jgi:hypothetical protein
MPTFIARHGLIALALAALLGASSAAVAETIAFKATLNAQSQVPPTDSKGTGTADVTYDSGSKV